MATPKDSKQIQLTINKLTKAQYASISPTELSTKYVDQLFMTTDDAGGGSSGSAVAVNAVVTSGTQIAVISVDGKPTTIFAPSQQGYATKTGDNQFTGNNTFTKKAVFAHLSASNEFPENEAIEDEMLIVTDTTRSYNLNYSALKNSIVSPIYANIEELRKIITELYQEKEGKYVTALDTDGNIGIQLVDNNISAFEIDCSLGENDIGGLVWSKDAAKTAADAATAGRATVTKDTANENYKFFYLYFHGSTSLTATSQVVATTIPALNTNKITVRVEQVPNNNQVTTTIKYNSQIFSDTQLGSGKIDTNQGIKFLLPSSIDYSSSYKGNDGFKGRVYEIRVYSKTGGMIYKFRPYAKGNLAFFMEELSETLYTPVGGGFAKIVS